MAVQNSAWGCEQVCLEHGATLLFASSLLQLRGRQAAAVPNVDSSGNILLFNGKLARHAVPVHANTGASGVPKCWRRRYRRLCHANAHSASVLKKTLWNRGGV